VLSDLAWGARALYVGPALGLSAHRNAVAVLALGLAGPFEVARDPNHAEAGYRACHSALIPPDTLHHLKADGPMAFLYVDPTSPDLDHLAATAGDHTPRAAFDLAYEADWIALARDLAGGRPWTQVRPILEQRLSARRDADARVRRSLELLHADPGARRPLDELASAAGLSASRARHLFRAATGVTVRRYRLWIAMGAALKLMARGEPLTRAALDAGFSSSSHFSAAFREMFGLEPSRLVKSGLVTRLA
jgi:AraC-like DNA-binding protein